METSLVLEILDRFGKVKERHKLTRFPVKIGRGYGNDIILDDPYVSPEHIELLFDGDGHLLVTDLKSENGLYSLHPLTRHDVLSVEENQRIRIGHTDIRLRTTDHPVRDTYIDRLRPSQLHLLFTNGIMLPVFLLLTAGVFTAYFYEQSFREVTLNSMLRQILPLFIYIFIWSGAWSIVSKVVTHKFYFAYHAILTCMIFAAFYLIEPLFDYIEFLYPVYGLADSLSIITDLALPMFLLYGNLRQSTPLTKRQARVAAMLTNIVFIGTLHLIAYIHQPDFSNQPQYSQVLKAPMFNPRKGESIDKFFTNTRYLSEFDIQEKKKPAKN